jgi:hypothetical protein
MAHLVDTSVLARLANAADLLNPVAEPGCTRIAQSPLATDETRINTEIQN